MLAIIGGTGFYDFPLLKDAIEYIAETPYGQAKYLIGRHNSKEFIFLSRHGLGHNIPPHMINYRANIYALKKAGAAKVLALNSVGGLLATQKVGDIVMATDMIDFTFNRENTFYNGGDEGLYHADMSCPYSLALTDQIAVCAKMVGAKIISGGIYAATQGPRFETPAEVRMLAGLGGTVVGMTGAPEVSLAVEAGLEYAALCVIANLGCGLTTEKITLESIQKQMQKSLLKVQHILTEAIDKL